MLTYSSMLRFCGQFFIKSEAKLDVLRMQILVVIITIILKFKLPLARGKTLPEI